MVIYFLLQKKVKKIKLFIKEWILQIINEQKNKEKIKDYQIRSLIINSKLIKK